MRSVVWGKYGGELVDGKYWAFGHCDFLFSGAYITYKPSKFVTGKQSLTEWRSRVSKCSSSLFVVFGGLGIFNFVPTPDSACILPGYCTQE